MNVHQPTRDGNGIEPRYRGTVRVAFPAVHSLRGSDGHDRAAQPHGHDFAAVFVFESRSLVYPGVVVDDSLRAEIIYHVGDRLAYRDLDSLLDRPATCEAIAEYLASWHLRSGRSTPHAWLVSVTVTTGSDAWGEVNVAPLARTATGP